MSQVGIEGDRIRTVPLISLQRVESRSAADITTFRVENDGKVGVSRGDVGNQCREFIFSAVGCEMRGLGFESTDKGCCGIDNATTELEIRLLQRLQVGRYPRHVRVETDTEQ